MLYPTLPIMNVYDSLSIKQGSETGYSTVSQLYSVFLVTFNKAI